MSEAQSKVEKVTKRIKRVGTFSQILGWMGIIVALIILVILIGAKELRDYLFYGYLNSAFFISLGVILIILGNRIKHDLNKNTKKYVWAVLILSGIFGILSFTVGSGKPSLMLLLFAYSIYALTLFKHVQVSNEKPKYKIMGKKWILVGLLFLIIMGVGLVLDLNKHGYFISEENLVLPKTLLLPNIDLKPGWQRVYIKDVGNIDIPPTMEVQVGTYKEFVDVIKKIIGYDTNQLVIQQKGLNMLDKEGFGTYARLMIGTDKGKPGDFLKLNSDISDITQRDLDEMNVMYSKLIKQSFLGTGLKLIEWYPLKVKIVNGMPCSHINYKRQFNDNPHVMVNMYVFFNYDRTHTLTMSYRLFDKNKWQTDFETILKSFRITNIK